MNNRVHHRGAEDAENKPMLFLGVLCGSAVNLPFPSEVR
jgi:hypothetical protein